MTARSPKTAQQDRRAFQHMQYCTCQLKMDGALGLSVTMVGLPLGLPIGLAGVLVCLWGLCGTTAKKAA